MIIEIKESRKEYELRKNDVLVMITAGRKKGVLEYKVDCASNITNEEFEYYLGEIIKGICEWKPGVCEENMRSHVGTIKQKKK
jgi:hypothetical protein